VRRRKKREGEKRRDKKKGKKRESRNRVRQAANG
jgi:hypothetical protein